MESETFTFDDWLERVLRNNGHDLESVLNTISARFETAFGAQFWFAEIFGRRWSYLAGIRAVRPVWKETERVFLAPGLGMVINNWGRLNPEQRERLIVFLEELSVYRRSSQILG